MKVALDSALDSALDWARDSARDSKFPIFSLFHKYQRNNKILHVGRKLIVSLTWPNNNLRWSSDLKGKNTAKLPQRSR